MTLKIKRFGKNKIAFKKLVADENTKFCYEGREAREIFKRLIGYEFMTKLNKDGSLEITGADGESFIVNTTYEIEII